MAISLPPNVKRHSSSEQAAEAFISGAGSAAKGQTGAPAENGKAIVNMRFNAALLARVDAAARRSGVSRTAWLHMKIAKVLDDEAQR